MSERYYFTLGEQKKVRLILCVCVWASVTVIVVKRFDKFSENSSHMFLSAKPSSTSFFIGKIAYPLTNGDRLKYLNNDKCW